MPVPQLFPRISRFRMHAVGRRLSALIPTALAAAALTATIPAPVHSAEFNLPEGPNRALVYAKCRTCHDLQYVVESKGLSAAAWDGLLSDMEGFGVELTEDEYRKILTYLSTYMGDKPAPKAPAATAAAQPADGATLFAENCTSCHQEDAKGIEETFPPLAGNDDLFLSAEFPALVLLNGMSGNITVNGQEYEGDMPPFGHLSDAEIAALVTYLRNSFGNDAKAHPDIPALSAKMVAALRDKPMEPDQVLAFRASLK